VTCSGATTARIALDVPIVTAQVELCAHCEPMFAAAPSPMAGNQGTRASAGQRVANSGVRPYSVSERSPSVGK